MLEQKGYKPVVLGQRFALRIEDLRDEHILEIRCLVCREYGQVFASVLIKKFSKHARLTDVERKFKCSKCGSKDVSGWKVFIQ